MVEDAASDVLSPRRAGSPRAAGRETAIERGARAAMVLMWIELVSWRRRGDLQSSVDD
jgi:hypothetical protein